MRGFEPATAYHYFGCMVFRR